MGIVKRETTLLLRDRASVFLLFLFPVALVFLLGNMLANSDMADYEIDTIPLYYTVEATGPQAAMVGSFIQGLEDSGMVALTPAARHLDAKQAVDTGEAAAAVLFTEALDMEVYQGFNSAQNRAVDLMLSGFARSAGAMQALAQQAPGLLPAAVQLDTAGLVAEATLPYNRTMLDYYAVTMLVMMLFMGAAIGACGLFYEGRRDGTLGRVAASPKSRVAVYLGSVASTLPQLLLQLGVIMLANVLLFRASYAATPAHNLLLVGGLSLAGLAVAAMFMVVGLYVPVHPMLLVMPLSWVMMFLSGTASKAIYVPGVTEAMPIWIIQNAAFELTVYGRPQSMYRVMAVSAVILVVFTLAGAYLFRRKELAK